MGKPLHSPSTLLSILAATLMLGVAPACDSSDSEVSDKFKVDNKYVPLSEREVKVKQTPEELAEIRKKSGFKSQEELAEENRKGFPISIYELCALWQFIGERQARR